MSATLAKIPIMKPWLGQEEQAAAAAAVASGWVAQGPRVAEFEAAFAAAFGTQNAVALSSCTTALHLALVVAEIGRGAEVVVPSLSFIATSNVARYVGAEPVFADVDPVTQNVTADSIEAVMTASTRAVIAVDQGGMPLDLEPIRALCDKRDVVLIEDAACAAGSTYRGEPVGAHAPLAAFSFHPRKILTTGEGGMLTTINQDWARRAILLRQHGMSLSAADRHDAGSGAVIEQYLEVGFNYRMTDIQAAVGLVQLERLDTVVEQRRALADNYRNLLSGVDGLGLPEDPAWGTTNYQSYSVLLPPAARSHRNRIMDRMGADGISTRRGIMAAHMEPAYDGHPHGPLPSTETLTQGSLILPLFHELGEDDQKRVANSLMQAIQECT